MFRDAAKDGRIWVDLFGPAAPQGVPGHLIDYDMKSEVGLMRIATTYPVQPAHLRRPDMSLAQAIKSSAWVATVAPM